MDTTNLERARELADQLVALCHSLGDPLAGDCVLVGLDRLEQRLGPARSSVAWCDLSGSGARHH
jgi:hypothetical protein